MSETGHDHDQIHHDHHHEGDHGGRRIRSAVRDLFRPHSHDAADSVDSALESSSDGIRAVKVSLVALGLTALAQAVLVVVTGSVALLADTIHNFSDALTALPLWLAFAMGRRRATASYTYGFGRAEDLAGLFVVLMIAASGVLVGYESVRRLIDPVDVTYPWAVVVAGMVGFAGNELVAAYRIRVGRRIGSAALVADGLHARTDGFTSLAVVLGAIGVMLGFPLADPIVGLVITLAIVMVLRSAARDIYRRLMDAVDPAMTERATSTLQATTGVVDVEYLRLRWLGHRIVAEAGLLVDRSLTLIEAHEIAVEAEHRLLHGVPKLVGATVHVSPSGEAGDEQHRRLHHHLARPNQRLE